MERHPAADGVAGRVDARRVDAGFFFDIPDHFSSELDVVVVGTAGTDVPAVAHPARFGGALRVERDDTFLVGERFVPRVIHLALAAAKRVVVHDQGDGLVALVGARHMHDELALA